jgi:iron complex outermembrane recepter protein
MSDHKQNRYGKGGTSMSKRIASLGAVGAMTLGVASPVWAQQTTEAAGGLEEVVVTGSRIARPGFEAPTPLTMVQADELQRKAPGALADGLNQLPQFQNSTTTSARSTGTGGAQNTGNYLNMRALGTNRVLVLQDGQRMATTGNNGGVDVSLIPSMLVANVDVVTGGASAVYGSDAVSGVVNFVLNKRLEGLQIQAQAGTGTGDAEGLDSYRFGAAGGVALLDDRLHIVASAERYHSDPLNRRYFPIMAEGWTLNGNGTAANPYRHISGTRSLTLSNGGIVTTGPLAGQQFDPSGNLVPFNPGTPTNIAGVNIGGDGGYFSQDIGTTGSSQTMNQFFIRPEYDFGNDLLGFVSVGYNFSNYESNPGGGFIRQIRIFSDNAFLTNAQRTALGTTPSFDMGRIFPEGPQHDINQESDSLVINAGLSGRFGESYRWNVGVGHTETEFTSSQRDMEFSKFYAAIDAVRDPSGNIVCRVLLDPNPDIRARYQGCAPANPFGQGNVSAEAYDYFWGTSSWRTENEMDSIQATVAGDLFKLPAGPLSFAAGAEYREVSLVQTSNANPAIPVDFTGLRGVLPTQMTRYRLMNNGVAEGSQDVGEVFAEVNVPVLKDSVIGSLELSGAARVTDYSTSGNVTTWKFGALFDPIQSIRFRGTVSRDIRAPSLFELYAAQQNVSQSFSDPLTQRNYGIQLVSGGNPNLEPEDAETITAGIVLTPTFIPGLSFSADYFDIDITGAIAAPFTAQQILDLCHQSNYTSPVCELVIRPLGPSNPSPDNIASSILLVSGNLASQQVRGIDFELAHSFEIGNGRMGIRALATRMLDFDQTNAEGQPVRHLVGTADFAQAAVTVPLPEWKGLIDINYVNGGLTAGIQERYIGSFDRSHVQFYEKNGVPAVFYTDLNLSYRFAAMSGALEIFGVVNNLFDEEPPLAPTVQAAPGLNPPYYVNTYDLIGRYVTLGARLKF